MKKLCPETNKQTIEEELNIFSDKQKQLGFITAACPSRHDQGNPIG